jgi:hypothetical protein
VSESERTLLAEVFGIRQIDMHDDFGVMRLENELSGGLSLISTGAPLDSTEDAYDLIRGWYPDNEWHTVNSLEFIGENESYWCFRMDITYHEPTIHEISRILVEKNDVPIPTREQNFQTRESAIRRIEEVLNEKVAASELRETLRKLTAVVDEMHAISEIWATPCDCHKYIN